MKLKYVSIALVSALLLGGCGESLEDTYKEYAGDGAIRYLGRCKDIEVQPGWERIVVKWTNSVDPLVEQVKVRWSYNDVADSVLLSAGTTEYSINQLAGQQLGDKNIEVTLCTVGKDGSQSLTNTVYGRAYSYAHEDVECFNRIVSAVYRVKSRVALTFLAWQDGIKEARLQYTKADGTPAELELTKAVVNQKFLLLDDEVDITKPIVVQRTAQLPNCLDEIVFQPMELDNRRTYNSDFTEDLRRQYGISEISDSWADQQTTLYLDYDLTSLIDLLNFPNLKKVVIGSRRYIPESEVGDATYAQIKLEDANQSIFALKTLNTINGLTVERYNQHYRTLTKRKIPFITEMGMPEEPNVQLVDLMGASMTVLPSEEGGFDAHIGNLFDGDRTTYWEPMRRGSAVNYQVIIAFPEVREMSGVRIVQRKWENEQEKQVMPRYVSVLLSDNGHEWGYATHLDLMPIGTASGEACYIDFATRYKARQVLVTFSSAFYFNLNFTSLAEISIY